MSGDDYESQSEYASFFSALRIIFGIADERQEIRREVRDVLGVVEAGYAEEKKRHKKTENLEEKIKVQIRYYQRIISDNQLRKLLIIVSLAGLLLLPVLVVVAVFSMNLTDLPTYVSYKPLLLAAICFSALTLILVLVINWGIRRYELRSYNRKLKSMRDSRKRLAEANRKISGGMDCVQYQMSQDITIVGTPTFYPVNAPNMIRFK